MCARVAEAVLNALRPPNRDPLQEKYGRGGKGEPVIIDGTQAQGPYQPPTGYSIFPFWQRCTAPINAAPVNADQA